MPRVCLLKSLFNEIEVNLKTGVETVLGRSLQTNVTDLACSRQQVSLNLLPDNQSVIVKLLGANPSSLNGIILIPNMEYRAKHEDILELLPNKFKFKFMLKSSDIIPTEALTRTTQGYDSWESVDKDRLFILTSKGVAASSKIAAFDIDGTIIKTKSGNIFAKTPDDWQIAFPQVPGKLNKLHSDGYKIAFFTNQRGVELGKVNIKELKSKIQQIVAKIGTPVQVFVATSSGYYRKPQIGMWSVLESEKNEDIKINYDQSFFVGDAAGRPEKKAIKVRKDHSYADRYMALNVGIKFYTPEEYFQGIPTEKWDKLDYDPLGFVQNAKKFEDKHLNIPIDQQEIILMVGLPGSGKSHFCHKYLKPKGYMIINQDSLKTWQKCVSALEEALRCGKSAVIDNTNMDATVRNRYIKFAKSYQIPCRCFCMSTSERHCKHNIAFREIMEPLRTKISAMVFNSFKKYYEAPKVEEGFDEILTTNFTPYFESDNSKKLYQMYLLEK